MNYNILNGFTDELEKLSFFSWGGRSKYWGEDGVPLQVGVGYSNMLGIVPYPFASVRVGDRDKAGLSIGLPLHLGIDNRASRSFTEREGIKGILDLAIEKIEDKIAAKKAAMKEEE